jgi:hypothetical protein
LCKKKAAPKGGPKSREETPKEAYAASLLHCDKYPEMGLDQWERQVVRSALRHLHAYLPKTAHTRSSRTMESRRVASTVTSARGDARERDHRITLSIRFPGQAKPDFTPFERGANHSPSSG